MPVRLEPATQPAPRRRSLAEPPLQQNHPRQKRTRRTGSSAVRREIALRVLGALALPALFVALQLLVSPNQPESLVYSLRGPIYLMLRDRILGAAFLLGLMAVGYQAVARRRAGRTLLAGAAGLLLSVPLAAGLTVLLERLPESLWKMSIGNTTSGYLTYFFMFLGASLFLFASWSAALGTRVKNASLGSGLFTLLTYLVFQVRDCFVTPELWHQWHRMLPAAALTFVLPAMLLGGASAALCNRFFKGKTPD